MVEVTRSLVGPGSKIYKAVILQAESKDDILTIVNQVGISLEDMNDVLKIAQKDKYLASLDSTIDSRIAKLYAALLDNGYDESDARTMSEANRAKMDKGLPKGLTAVLNEDGTPKLSQRGKKADEAEPTAPATV